ncbi:MAG: exodeoxyribonuclease VII large subunit, partial [Hydrogenophilales bacterium 17-62-8]
ADFAADLRAPTPTAAAELASPVRQDLLLQLGHLTRRLHEHLARKLRNDMQQLDYLARRLVHPAEQLRQQQLGLTQLSQRLGHATRNRLSHEQHRMAQLRQRLITPRHRIQHEQRTLSALLSRFQRAAQTQAQLRKSRLTQLGSSLAHLNPEGVLARGYSIVQQADGAVVHDAATLHASERLNIRFHRGRASATVDSIQVDTLPASEAR